MSKRIKRAFGRADEVIHRWANQTQDKAWSRNTLFEGKSVYSYGHHFELGRLVEYKGVTVAFINGRRASHTTSKHISYAWSAVENIPRFKLEDFGNPSTALIPKLMLERQGTLIDDMFSHFSRTRFYGGHCFRDSAEYGVIGDVKRFNRDCETLGFESLKLEIDQDYIDLYNEHVKIRVKRQVELQSPELIAKREAARVKRAAGAIDRWRQGGPATSEIRSLPRQLLRIKGDDVETSRGATVPVTHAMRLLNFILKGQAKPGDKVGVYSLSNVKYEVVQIGCHTIDLSEAKSVLVNVQPRLALVGGES